ncbi:MAG: cysteine desulfurase family protein [Nanoarchaeota archaeon]|mgnify:FL=1
MANKIVYLDCAATMPLYKEVAKEMEKFNSENYGNPSSQHQLGENAQKSINEARRKIANEINAKPQEIIFTSGSTESNNMAIFGLAKLNKNKRKIIISAIEHSSIFEICNELKKDGYEIIEIPVNKEGIIDLNELEEKIDKDALLVSIIHVNNEIGSIQDIEKIGRICKENGVYFHTDTAQGFGKLNIDVKKMNVDLLTASGHKIGGPKGIGLLYVRENIPISPIIFGGGQERNLRGGTENVPAIMGFVKAVEIIKRSDKEKIKVFRNYFIQQIEELEGKINGSKEKAIPNIINIYFPKADAEKIVLFLSQKGIMCSTGSACDSKKKNERVLKAIGSSDSANKSIRFSFSDKLEKKDIDFVTEQLNKVLKNLDFKGKI